MALVALDFGLELDPAPMEAKAAVASAQEDAAGRSNSGASADTACWAPKHKQPVEAGCLSDDQQCTSSGGCSYSGGAALSDGALLELEDDACSSLAPPPSAAARQAAAAAERLKHLHGSALVAANFFDDLAAKGSLYEYCIRR